MAINIPRAEWLQLVLLTARRGSDDDNDDGLCPRVLFNNNTVITDKLSMAVERSIYLLTVISIRWQPKPK